MAASEPYYKVGDVNVEVLTLVSVEERSVGAGDVCETRRVERSAGREYSAGNILGGSGQCRIVEITYARRSPTGFRIVEEIAKASPHHQLGSRSPITTACIHRQALDRSRIRA